MKKRLEAQAKIEAGKKKIEWGKSNKKLCI